MTFPCIHPGVPRPTRESNSLLKYKYVLGVLSLLVLARIWTSALFFWEQAAEEEPRRGVGVPQMPKGGSDAVEDRRISGMDVRERAALESRGGGAGAEVADSEDALRSKSRGNPTKELTKQVAALESELERTELKLEEAADDEESLAHSAEESLSNDNPEPTMAEDGSLDSATERIEILPTLEALQPVTFQGCCMPPIWNESQKNLNIKCSGTCYNRRACDDPLYPYASEEEKAALPLLEKPRGWRQTKRQQCLLDVAPTPPVEWCQQPYEGHGSDAAAHLIRHYPPAGCTAISQGGGSGAFQHAIVFPAAKLVFCGIPKAGITQWEMFLRFTFGAKDYPSMPHFKYDREFFQFDKLTPEAQRRIWEGKEWTWAAFLRDPAERLLSAYLDKVKGTSGKPTRYAEKLKGQAGNASIDFDEFIDIISKPVANVMEPSEVMHGLSWFTDPHWRPQVYTCGLSERLDRFQFIGELGNVESHTKELLQHVGLWESHGKHFINGGVVGEHKYCAIQSHPANKTGHVGFQQRDEANGATGAKNEYGHVKDSRTKMDQFYTPKSLKRVQEELYADDYKLWKLVSANGNELSRGKELMSKLSTRCSDPSFK